MRPRRLSAAAFIAVALALGSGAAAQVKIGGKEVMLANNSSYQPSLNDLPAPPTLATAPAERPGGSVRYSNSFECIPDSAPAPGETITIDGQYDLQSTRAARPVRRPTPTRLSGK